MCPVGYPLMRDKRTCQPSEFCVWGGGGGRVGGGGGGGGEGVHVHGLTKESIVPLSTREMQALWGEPERVCGCCSWPSICSPTNDCCI